jgi:diguanylate cyclase (GGDEF)-like protein/PAS domain S-box-containing protein
VSDDDAHNLRAMLDAIPAPIFYKDAKGIYRGCNKAFEAYLGKRRDEIIGKDVYGLSPKELADVYKKADDELFASRTTQLYEARVRYADGTYRDVMFHKATFDDAHGNLAGMIGTILDITARKRAEARLKESEQRYRTVVSALGEGIVLFGRDHRVLAANQAAESLLGLDQSALMAGTPWPLLAEDGTPLAFERSPIVTTLDTGDEASGAVLGLARPDGSRAWISLSTRAIYDLSDTKPTSVVVSFADITEKRSFQQQLEHQAFHDPLTGLPNRQLFMDRLHHAIDLARRRSVEGRARIAVAFVDLDHFKDINDKLGHAAGDRLLAEIGRRLASTLRGSDFVARLGGDEFCAILTDVADEVAARSIATRMLAAIVPVLELDGRSFHVTASIGLSLYPDHATEPAILLRHADQAMYRVKERGKNAVGLFAPS